MSSARYTEEEIERGKRIELGACMLQSGCTTKQEHSESIFRSVTSSLSDRRFLVGRDFVRILAE